MINSRRGREPAISFLMKEYLAVALRDRLHNQLWRSDKVKAGRLLGRRLESVNRLWDRLKLRLREDRQ